MEELLKKEEGLTSWRFKLNRILGRIAGLLKGSEGKSILASSNGQVYWEPVKEEQKIEDRSEVDALSVNGVLNATTAVVTGGAYFRCNIETSGNVIAGGLSATDAIVLKGNGRTESIYASEKGLTLGPATFDDKVAELPSMLVLGGKATIGATASSFSIYGKACPIKLNIETGGAEFPYGITAKSVNFTNGSIDAEEYCGNAFSAGKLKKTVKIFGINFDGTADLSGHIKDCTGLTLSKGSKMTFVHGIGTMGADWLSCNGDVLEWTSRFKPRSFNVESEHYAAWYPCSGMMENGDVVSLDFSSETEMYAKVNAEKKHPLGVVTTDYAMCIGMQDSRSYPVCCKGRVKAKVEGKVKKGDSLTVGSIDGVLRAMNSKDKAYEAWAVALEDSDKPDVKLVRVHII